MLKLYWLHFGQLLQKLGYLLLQHLVTLDWERAKWIIDDGMKEQANVSWLFATHTLAIVGIHFSTKQILVCNNCEKLNSTNNLQKNDWTGTQLNLGAMIRDSYKSGH